MNTPTQNYERADLEKLRDPSVPSQPVPTQNDASLDDPSAKNSPASNAIGRVRLWLVLPLSLILCLVQAIITIVAENVQMASTTSTQISVMAFAVLLLLVLLINPVLRWIMRPLGRAELMCIFASILVTAGVSTFGLTSQLVPLIGTPWNPQWNTPQRGWSEHVNPQLNESLYLTDPQMVRTFREGVRVPKPPGQAGMDQWLTYYSDVLVAVPWGVWLMKLGAWLVFITATYAMFYCLSYVVLDYWARREKLIFPLAKLGEAVLPDRDSGHWPHLFRGSGFWIGFALSFCLLGFNALVAIDLLPGFGRIPLGMDMTGFESLSKGTALEGLSGNWHGMGFLIVFTAIGIAFLLPLETSFSTWFYFLMGKLMLWAFVWMGMGQTTSDFPSDWLWQHNAISAQGAGGLILFSAISLWRCLREYVILVRHRDRSWKQRFFIALPVVGLFISQAVMAGWLAWNSIPILWALIIVAFLTLLTLGLMRIVAESGIYWFQAHASFFHFYNMLGAGSWGWLGGMALKPILLGPLLLIYSPFFLDLKTFIAPNLVNAAKLNDDVRGDRARFHINLIITLTVTVLVALLFTVYMAHLRGAQQMHSWFYTGGPTMIMDAAQRATTTASEFDASTTGWHLVGGVWVTLTMIIRRTLFWFPHPIGYIMLVNPLMSSLWFSFFIGWIVKKFVVRYGGKNTFDKVRILFIGLILGELIAVALWTLLTALDVISNPGITLNRYFS